MTVPQNIAIHHDNDDASEVSLTSCCHDHDDQQYWQDLFEEEDEEECCPLDDCCDHDASGAGRWDSCCHCDLTRRVSAHNSRPRKPERNFYTPEDRESLALPDFRRMNSTDAVHYGYARRRWSSVIGGDDRQEDDGEKKNMCCGSHHSSSKKDIRMVKPARKTDDRAPRSPKRPSRHEDRAPRRATRRESANDDLDVHSQALLLRWAACVPPTSPSCERATAA